MPSRNAFAVGLASHLSITIDRYPADVVDEDGQRFVRDEYVGLVGEHAGVGPARARGRGPWRAVRAARPREEATRTGDPGSDGG